MVQLLLNKNRVKIYKIYFMYLKMVSLSTNEMLRQMVENYGFGVTLFELTTLEQLEIIKKLYPVFETYVDDLLKGRIYDPAAKEALIKKYDNNRWVHPPKKYEIEIPQDFWKSIENYSESDNLNQTQFTVAKQVNLMVGMSYNPEIDSEPIAKFRKGDVLYVHGKNSGIEIESYYILDKYFENVYFRYNDIEVTDILAGSFNMLVDTPANFWSGTEIKGLGGAKFNDMEIPDLKIYYDFPDIFEEIKWSKMQKSGQDYLVGKFKIHQKNQILYIPIQPSSLAASKLAISLQLQKINYFYPKDPKNIIPNGPNIIFATVANEIYFLQLEEKERIEEI